MQEVVVSQESDNQKGESKQTLPICNEIIILSTYDAKKWEQIISVC